MKAYYHAHESAYQQIKLKGYFGWGNAINLEELSDQNTLEYLHSSIIKWVWPTDGKHALDLGCGSGSTAFAMAKTGMLVTGVDISETAIEMACDLALKQNLNIQFVTGDVLQLSSLNQKFDLIYDSHCLHCIVFEDDRRKVFAEIRNSLSEIGIFILDTMVLPDGYCDPTSGMPTLRFDSDNILWHKTHESKDRGIVAIAGQYWCAQRRIYSPEKVMDEILQAGFSVVSQTIDFTAPNSPLMLRLILKAT